MVRGGDARPSHLLEVPMREKPTCQKCNGRHYNFHTCDEAKQVEARAEVKRQSAPFQQFSTPEGSRVWGSRAGEGKVLWAGSVFEARKARSLGRVVEPPDAAA